MKVKSKNMYKSRDVDEIIREDLEQSIMQINFWDELKGKTILITGATGLLGRHIVSTLLYSNRVKNSEIKIIALVRNMEKAKAIYGKLVDRPELQFVVGDIRETIEIGESIDYIIHMASITDSKTFVEQPVETIAIALEGTKNILEFARVKKVKGFVYSSSLEVYGIPMAKATLISETEYGYIDPLNVRSSYSESKRMVECMCYAYAKQYGIPVKIARLTQSFGPGVEYFDNRVFAQFAKSAIEKKDIILHTKGETVRNYCYTRDAVTALLTILVKGQIGEAYNIANQNTGISIRKMAEMVTEIYADTGIKVCYQEIEQVEKLGYNPVAETKLDSKKLEQLGWQATVDLPEMLQKMISSMEKQRRLGEQFNEVWHHII